MKSPSREKQLTPSQKKAFDILKSGKNIFLTGGAGTGKSFLLSTYISYCKRHSKSCLVCAPTAIAALQLEGTTIHSAFGLPPTVLNYSDTDVAYTPSKDVQSADVIIVDEISMCRIDLFDTICAIISKADEEYPRKAARQLICSGDFYQLPPVITREDRPALDAIYPKTDNHQGSGVGDGYAFQATRWKSREFANIFLKEVKRQSDDSFIHCLNQVRVGDASCIPFIYENMSKSKLDDGITLFPTVKAADKFNEAKLEALENSSLKTFAADNQCGKIGTKFSAPESLSLKVGAKVMALVNDPADRFFNGSLGTVLQLPETEDLNGEIQVKFDRYQYPVSITAFTWTIEKPVVERTRISRGKTTVTIKRDAMGSYTQYPLRLAYAMTIHKSQGQSYDAVNIDPSTWAAGQLYVALSRAIDIKKLHVDREILEQYLKVSSDVESFYQELASVEDSSDASDLSLPGKLVSTPSSASSDEFVTDSSNLYQLREYVQILNQSPQKWHSIYDILHAAEVKRSWQGTYSSYTAWLENFSDKTRIASVNQLWRYKKAGDSLEEIKARHPELSAGSNIALLSQDSLILIAKIREIAPSEAYKYEIRLLEGTTNPDHKLTASDLRIILAELRKNLPASP